MTASVTTQETPKLPVARLAPQLAPGQVLYILRETDQETLDYALQEKADLVVYCCAAIVLTDPVYFVHLLVSNRKSSDPIHIERQNVFLSNRHGVTAFPCVVSGPSADCGLYFQKGSAADETPITVSLTVADEEFRFRFDVPTPEEEQKLPQQRQFEAWQRTKPPPPIAPFRDPNCLCLECADRMWSPLCERPVNLDQPHQGPNCPYCNSPLLSTPVKATWHPSLDSLYSVLGWDKMRWCDHCKFYL